MTPRARLRLQTAGAVISTAVAVGGAVAAAERARAVDVVALFAGGVGVGATLTGLVRAARELRRRAAGALDDPSAAAPPAEAPPAP